MLFGKSLPGVRRGLSSLSGPAERFLDELQAARPSIELGLRASLSALQAVGDPQRRLRVVHVAGTNGKGSVCSMVAAGLRTAGCRVGVYTSPHIR